VSGIDINKTFIDTRANLTGTDTSKYYLVKPKCFACNLMHIGRDEKIPIAYNDTNSTLCVTSAYYIFKKKDKLNTILDEYINVFFHCSEFDRRTYFYTDSSVRGNLKENRFLEIKIPVPFKDGKPDIERQQEVVNIWDGLRKLRDDNLAIAEPLLRLCEAKVEELKKTTPMVELGQFIEPSDERNISGKYTIEDVSGVSIEKRFIPTKANMKDVALDTYKVVKTNDFCFVPITSRNGNRITIALNSENKNCIVSSSYEVFRLRDNKDFDSAYVFLWFCRSEFDRYARYNSWGSAREAFSFEEMRRVKVPKASIEVQQAIVDIYQCAKRAKDIAADADKQLKTICPALLQYVIHN
jgi:type I restriction enzyme S subunit